MSCLFELDSFSSLKGTQFLPELLQTALLLRCSLVEISNNYCLNSTKDPAYYDALTTVMFEVKLLKLGGILMMMLSHVIVLLIKRLDGRVVN